MDRAGWEGDVYHKQQFKQFDREETGSVWGDKRDKHVKKPLRKRQLVKKCQNNPLQIANMMATIAGAENEK